MLLSPHKSNKHYIHLWLMKQKVSKWNWEICKRRMQHNLTSDLSMQMTKRFINKSWKWTNWELFNTKALINLRFVKSWVKRSLWISEPNRDNTKLMAKNRVFWYDSMMHVSLRKQIISLMLRENYSRRTTVTNRSNRTIQTSSEWKAWRQKCTDITFEYGLRSALSS